MLFETECMLLITLNVLNMHCEGNGSNIVNYSCCKVTVTSVT